MIRLFDILKEISAEQKATSWLDPHGNFHYVDHNHGSTAHKLTGDEKDPMLILWKKGWFRVTYYSHTSLFAHNEFMLPNAIQKRKIIDLAIELGFRDVKYDGGEGSKILWSQDDILQ